MKAAVLEKYDKNGCELALRDVPVPEPGDGDVLVRVLTAGVNPLDNMVIRGEVKLIVGYKTPFVMGHELTGIVEKVGSAVTRFQPGERVYARLPLDRVGAFADYAAVDQAALAHVPAYLSDEEASAVPLTALTAMQAYDLMDAKPGASLFISGGTGSVGAMAIPLAKHRGFEVVTSGSAANRDRVIALGASRFIDYKTEDYADVLHDIDYVLDTLGDKELPKEFSILREGGTLVSLRGLPNGAFARRMGMPWLKRMMFAAVGGKYDRMAAKKGQTYHFIFVHSDGAQLEEVSRVFEQNSIRPAVDKVFPLEEVNEALHYIARGGSRGKTILRVTKA